MLTYEKDKEKRFYQRAIEIKFYTDNSCQADTVKLDKRFGNTWWKK